MNRIISLLAFSFLFFSTHAQIISVIQQQKKGFKITPSTNVDGYTLLADANTSAAVFQGQKLIQTLWNNKRQTAGFYPTPYWNGMNDEGSEVSNAPYTIVVTENNIKAKWGLVGNTSADSAGPAVQHAADVVTSMAFAGGYAYYSVGYFEGHPSYFKFSLSDPQKKIDYLPGQGQITLFEATDGVRVYHAGQGVPTTLGHIFATRLNDDSLVLFNSGIGIQVQNGRYLPSVIDTNTTTLDTGDPGVPADAPKIPECNIGGMTVQKNGKYLFISHFDKNDIKVYDVHTVINGKPSGALIQTITLANAKAMCVDADDDNSIWIVSGTNTVAKYTINANGTLTSATLTLSGLVTPLAVTCKSGKVAVADGSTRQQVRIFNNLNGVEGAPLGQLGGYSTDATVANDKFMFKNTKELFRGERNTWIAYGLDGSLWVGDRGNYRVQHFSATNTFIKTIMNVGYHYSSAVDRNNPTRVFANYLEFALDYSKPLAPNNGSWTLVKNWAYPATIEYDNMFDRMKCVSTLSNGRTYCLLQHVYGNGNHRFQVMELPTNGNLRFTGVEPTISGQQFDVFYTMDADGSLIRKSNGYTGVATQWIKRPLTGFDGSGNPQWGADDTIARVPPLTNSDPVSIDGVATNSITSTGKLISQDQNHYDPVYGRGGGYHLGAVALGGTDWLWRVAPSTNSHYGGVLFPNDGFFEIANGVKYAGGYIMTADSLIVAGYHGENWQGLQTNVWNLWLDNGLLLTQFGIDGFKARDLGEAAPQMAGNTILGTMAKIPGGDFIVSGNDESYHGASQLWRISGINTIQHHQIAIVKSGVPVGPTIDYIDLMAGVPYNDTLHNGTSRWIRTPAENDFTGGRLLRVNTNIQSYKKTDRDIELLSISQSGNPTTDILACDLGTNNTSHWKITGKFSPERSVDQHDNPSRAYLEILDTANKVISRLSFQAYSYPSDYRILLNDSIAWQGTAANFFAKTTYLEDISFTVNGGGVDMTYGTVTAHVPVFDPTCHWQNPKVIRVWMNTSNGFGHIYDVANMKFYDH